MLYKEEAILIRSMDYGEGNKIITLYTPNIGKVSVMARGAKKLKSRHTAATQLFTHGEFTYYKAGKMGTLNHAEIITSHDELRTDLLKTAYASYITEMVYRLTDEHEAGSTYLFQQLTGALNAVSDHKDPQIISHIFEVKMLHKAGYAPVLDRCAACGKQADISWFYARAGGVLCNTCKLAATASQGQQNPSSVPTEQPIQIDDKTWKVLRLFPRIDLQNIGNVTVSDQTKSKLKIMMRTFMDAHVDVRYWKSRKFLDQMDKYAL